MSLFPVHVNLWVLPAAVPYLLIAGYDFWLHENDRRVPHTEGVFHAIIISSVLAFLATAALGWDAIATAALAILIVAAVVDEVLFHADLDAHEKQLHNFGGIALLFCIGVWLWTI